MTKEPVRFKNPPIVEVACAIHFERMPAFKTAHVGLYWQSLRKAFPRLEEAPPIGSVIEPLGSPQGPQPPRVSIDVSKLPPLRRTWLLNENGSALIQIQQDRFVFNWRRVEDSDDYPSYNRVISEFERHWGGFCAFLTAEQIPLSNVKQFELTYTNFLGANGGVALGLPASVLVDHKRHDSPGRFLPNPEGYNWNTSYLLPENNGRLHISARSAVRTKDKEKIMRLELIARGIPKDVNARKMWFDLAHEWITFGFADITSEELHKTVWQRLS